MNRVEYLKTIVIDNRMINVGINDDAQCYFFEYLDEDGYLREVSCGAYCFDYVQEIKDYFGAEV